MIVDFDPAEAKPSDVEEQTDEPKQWMADHSPPEEMPVPEVAVSDAPMPEPPPVSTPVGPAPTKRPWERNPRPKTSIAPPNALSHQPDARPSAAGSSRPRTAAGLTSSPEPSYPPAAIAADFQGATRVRVVVGPDGRALRVDLATSSGRADCDRSARETVLRAWRFRPATVDGRPVESNLVVKVTFSLDS